MGKNTLTIDKKEFELGSSGVVKINVGKLPSNTRLDIQAHVFRSKKPGPCTLILAGVHGDEINGIEITRSLLESNKLAEPKKGTVIVIPLLNIYGFINFNRYVPDGKDVNRSFPGTQTGSLASRIARTLTKLILPHVDYIFDFHTGGDSRYNAPQVRFSKSDKKAYELAKIFNPPIIVESGIIPKSLRRIAKDLNIPILVFEGGESVRLNKQVIAIGLRGLLNCLQHIGHLEQDEEFNPRREGYLIKKTTWIRSSYSGIFLWSQSSGSRVNKGDKLGSINDPNGQKSIVVTTKKDGIIIGHNNASVINQGDALFHLGYEFEEIS